jgi:hypothetical protein
MVVVGLAGGKKRWLVQPVLFLVGFALAVWPLLAHQARLTGDLFHSTYTPADASPATWDGFGSRLEFYFTGQGSYLVVLAAAGLAALAMPSVVRSGRGRMVAIAVGLLWVLPTSFFLLHSITTPYYQLPTHLVTLFAAAMCVLLWPPEKPTGTAGRALLWASAVVVVAAALWIAGTLRSPDSLRQPVNEVAAKMPDTQSLPAVLKEPNAWIFGDRLVGSLWHYQGIAGHAILTMPAEARIELYTFIARRNEPIFVLGDDEPMEQVARELSGMGASRESVGTFCGTASPGKHAKFTDVYRVVWPKL